MGYNGRQCEEEMGNSKNIEEHKSVGFNDVGVGDRRKKKSWIYARSPTKVTEWDCGVTKRDGVID